jgi:hypothetical protein
MASAGWRIVHREVEIDPRLRISHWQGLRAGLDENMRDA